MRLGILLLCLFCPAGVVASELPQILREPPGAGAPHLPDFSYAGYGFGLLTLPPSPATVVNVADHGAIPDDGLDDSKGVLAAFAAAHAAPGPVTLRFPPGRFVISEVLPVTRSGIVIEGAGRGEGGTELYFPRPLRLVDRSDRLDELKRYLVREDKRQVEPRRNIDLPFSPYSWAGGFVWVQAPASRSAVYLDDEPVAKPRSFAIASADADGRRLRLAAPSGLQPGDIVQIRWTSPDGPESALLRSLYGTDMPAIGKRHWEDPARPIVVQTTRVVAVDGQLVDVANPLLHAVAAGQPATMVRWQGLRDVGIRDLAFRFPPGVAFGHHLEEGWNAIAMNDVFDGFIASVRVTDADSGILTYNSASLTIRDVLTDGDRVAHYSVHMGNVHNVLATGLDIRNRVIHALSFNTQSTRSVFQNAIIRRDAVLDQHAGANHQNLFDNIDVQVKPVRIRGQWQYPLWDGSGAGYWQPGHGRFNTSWNIRVHVESGALPGETVLLTGLDEGPDARIIGVSGNRPFQIDYRPMPYIDALNRPLDAVPSLYAWQLARRRLP